jgi:hypothetical protein
MSMRILQNVAIVPADESSAQPEGMIFEALNKLDRD